MPIARRLPALLTALVAGALAACGDDAPAPLAPTPPPPVAVADVSTSVAVADLAAAGVAAMRGGGTTGDGLALDRLPAELRLTEAQRSAIEALTRAFVQSTRRDVATIARVVARAEAALRAGRPAAEVRAILAEAADARRRLDAATRTLRTATLAVLTPAQRDWLARQWPPRCDGAPALTAEQVARIRALQQAQLAAVRSDVEALVGILAEALAARQAGRPAAEVEAILARATPIRERLAAAEARLRAEVEAVLTPEQRAARCPFVPPTLVPALPR